MIYEVHFLIEKTIMVEASDDIQAELEAAKMLKAPDRYNVRGFQYTDSKFDGKIPMKEFSEPDFEWWLENEIIDKHYETD